MLFLPRYADDWSELRALAATHPHIQLPQGALLGRDLLLKASLVISGGGTMVREAAVLGIPAASFFGGSVGGVDHALAQMGRLTLMRSCEDVDRLALPKETQPQASASEPAQSPMVPGSLRPFPDSAMVREHLRSAILEMLRDR